MSSLTPSASSVTIGTTAGWTLVINGLGASANWAVLQNGLRVASGIISSAGTYTSLGAMALYTDSTMSVLVYNSDASTTPLTSTITIATSGGSGYFDPLISYTAPSAGTSKPPYVAGFFNSASGTFGVNKTYPASYVQTDSGGHPNKIGYYVGFNIAGSGSSAPVIIGDISGTYSVTVGNSLVLTVTVTGALPMTYTWWKNGSSIGTVGVTDGTGLSNTLMETNRQLTDDGATYYCVVHNGLGNATSGTATLSVPSITKIWPITATPTLVGGDSYTNNLSYVYDEQSLTPSSGGEVAAYVTNSVSEFMNNTEPYVYIAPGSPADTATDDQVEYIVFTFPAGSIYNPTLSIVYDAVFTVPFINYVQDGSGLSLVSAQYGGSAWLDLEVSTTPGVWVTSNVLYHYFSEFDGSTGGVTITKTIDTSILTGTINTGTLQVRLKATTRTLSICSHPYYVGFSSIYAGDTYIDCNVYALYLSGNNSGIAPTITTNISGTSSLTVSDNLTLYVAANGTNPLTFTWYKAIYPGSFSVVTTGGDITITTTSTNSTLVDANRQITDSLDTYYCHVTNASGEATSGTVTLSVTGAGSYGFRPSAGTGVTNFPNVLTPNIDSNVVDTTTFSEKISGWGTSNYPFTTFGSGTFTGTLNVRAFGITNSDTVGDNTADSSIDIYYTSNLGSNILLCGAASETDLALDTYTSPSLVNIDLSTLIVNVHVNGSRIGILPDRAQALATLDLYDIVFLSS